jgi:hypothetical protein
MRNNDAITFEIGRRDLEVILENLSLTITKIERTQEALKDAADLIRAALQEDDSDEPDCENCDLPCRHNPNIIMRHEDELDEADRDLLEQLREVAEAVRKTGVDPDEAENELQKAADPVSEDAPENTKSPEDEDEAESLAIELLKAVFSVLAETIENGE